MGIQGRASMMLAEMDSSDPHFEHLTGIEEYVRSAADLTKQLLGFARGGKYEVKVLLSSGYSINGQAQEILRRGCQGFIQKPFNLRELSQRLAETLGRP